MRNFKILLSTIVLLCLAVQAYAQPEPGSPNIVHTDPAIREMQQALEGLSAPGQSASEKPQASSSLSAPAQGAFTDYKAKANDFLNGADASGYYTISIPDFINRTKIDTDWIVLDVRRSDEYSQGHIQNAINIPINNLISLMGTVPSGKRVAVYGSTNTEAAFCAMSLSIFGDREAYVLSDGISAWQQAGMPIV
jgi:rhodanese-related sulfurtransferase